MIPVHVLSGFLGSGKTTRLSRLLRRPAFSGTAVIVNEFGEIGLDHELVESGDEEVVLLGSGCLCCTLRSDLATTLLDLDRRRRDGSVAFERVVIETSGLADPAPILTTLIGDRALGERFVIGRIAVTVDALAGAETLARFGEARRQVAFADRLLLTKLDLAMPDPALMRRLASLNAHAEVVSGTNDEDPFGPTDTRRSRFVADDSDQAHTEGVASIVLLRDTPLPASVVPLFLEGLATQAGDRLLRLKGIVQVREAAETPLVIQAVQHVLHPPSWLEAWPSGDRRTRIVLIGQDLPLSYPGALLDALLAELASVAAARREDGRMHSSRLRA